MAVILQKIDDDDSRIPIFQFAYEGLPTCQAKCRRL